MQTIGGPTAFWKSALPGSFLVWLGLLAGCQPPGSPAGPPPVPSVKIAIPSGPSSLDPHMVAEEVNNNLCHHLFDPLVFLNQNFKVVPWVASAWQNPDAVTWIFTIRSDIRFHDGTPLTIDDVVFSLERIRRTPNSPRKILLNSIREVAVLDRQRLKITTHTPYMPLLNKLAQIMVVPAHYYRDREVEDVRFEPLGSGPYRAVRIRPGTEIRLEAWPEYWRGPQSPRQVQFVFVPGEELRTRMLLTGQADLIREPAPSLLQDLQGSKDFEVRISRGLRLMYLGLSCRERMLDGTTNPFAGKEIRQAISRAIDRRSLAADSLQRLAEPAEQPVSPYVFGYNPKLRVIPYDPAAAGERLRQNGFPSGRVFRCFYPEGKYYRIRELVGALCRQLSAVGVKWQPSPVEQQEFARRNFLEEGHDEFVSGWLAISGDASDYFDYCFYTRGQKAGYGYFNYIRYSNPWLDQRIEESAACADRDKRLRLLQDMMVVGQEEMVWVPLIFLKDSYAFRRGLAWTPRPDRYILLFEPAAPAGLGTR